jgi:hypothetical protein
VSSPRRIVVVAMLGALATLLLVASASAAATSPTHKPVKILHPPARVKVGRVELTRTTEGRPTLLVAVRYPIQAAGRAMRLVARFRAKPGTVPLAQAIARRLSAGPPRRPERRRTFTFVYEIDLKRPIRAALAKAWTEGATPTVTIEAQGGIDIDGDGKADIKSKGIPRRVLPLPDPLGQGARSTARAARAPGGSEPFCPSFPTIRIHPGNHTKIRLPPATDGCLGASPARPAPGPLTSAPARSPTPRRRPPARR